MNTQKEDVSYLAEEKTKQVLVHLLLGKMTSVPQFTNQSKSKILYVCMHRWEVYA